MYIYNTTFSLKLLKRGKVIVYFVKRKKKKLVLIKFESQLFRENKRVHEPRRRYLYNFGSISCLGLCVIHTLILPKWTFQGLALQIRTHYAFYHNLLSSSYTTSLEPITRRVLIFPQLPS